MPLGKESRGLGQGVKGNFILYLLYPLYPLNYVTFYFFNTQSMEYVWTQQWRMNGIRKEVGVLRHLDDCMPKAVSLVEQVSKVLSVMGQEEAGESLGAPMIPIQLPQGIVSSTSQVELLSQYLP